MKYRNKDSKEIVDAYQWSNECSIYYEPWKTYITHVNSYSINGDYKGTFSVAGGVPKNQIVPLFGNTELHENMWMIVYSNGAAGTCFNSKFILDFEPVENPCLVVANEQNLQAQKIIVLPTQAPFPIEYRLASRDSTLFLEARYVLTTGLKEELSEWKKVETHVYPE